MNAQPIYIYADESCLGNQLQDTPRPGGAAGLVESFDTRRGWHRRDYARFEADTTNNRMALLSAIAGLSALRRACDVVFVSDSRYLIEGMKEWIHGWARRGWRRKTGPVENLDRWRELVELAAAHRVEWRWIRGHSDHPKNEYANDLAVRTARSGQGIEGLSESGFASWLEQQIERGRFVDYLDVPPAEVFRPDPLPTL